MKRFLFIIASLLFIVACQNQKFPVEKVSADGSFYSTMEEVSATKTSLDGGGSVLWSEGDQVAIYKKSALKSRFQVTKESVGKAAGSFAQVQEADDVFHGGGEIPHNVVLYPYDAAESCLKNGEDSYKLEVNLPAVQTYAENTFSNGTFPMTAVSENNILTFKNICGGLKLQLTGVDKIRSIVLEGLADEALSGQGTVIAYVDNSAPVINMDVDASKTVTLDCGEEGVQLQEDVPTVFILSVPPVKFTSGLKITVTDTEDFSRVMINRSENNAIKRSSLLSFKPIAYKQDEVLELPGFPDVEEGEAPTYEVVAEGGSVEIPIKTNQDIEVQILDEAASWIRWVETKAVREETIILEVEENTTPEPRSAEIFIVTTEGVTLQSIVFTQEAGDPMKPTDPDEFGLIDLGLSVKWANYNMGATSVSGYGTATDWGHEEGSDASLPHDMNISGSEYDLVKAELGGDWRLPTAFDFMELEQKCTWNPTTIDGVSGNLITGPNGNKIFLPDVVYWTGTAREKIGENHDYIYGVYWTPEGVTNTTSKYNRPVQGSVRVYPRATIDVTELGKNTATVEAVITDYETFGVDLDLTLAVSSTGTFDVKPTTKSEGKYTFYLDGLSSSHTYHLIVKFDVFEWFYSGNPTRHDITTDKLMDWDGIEPHPVDLGLSVKWAEWNLGASCRSDKGFKLNWGAISINDDARIDLKDIDIAGTQYDPATKLWGPEWRLPRPEEWAELIGSYQNLRATNHAMGGVLLQDKIFLPGDGVTYYLSGTYNKGCYFLYDAYCYSGSLPTTSKSYVRPVYDPLPQLGEVTVSQVTSSTAYVSSSVVRIGGSTITKKGFVYSTDENPTLENAILVTSGSHAKTLGELAPGTVYYVRSYATNSYGTSYGKVVSFTTASLDVSAAVDLSKDGTANCYIVPGSGSYKFKPTKGNSNQSVGNISSVEVLWESHNSTVTPYEGEIIRNVHYIQNVVYFEAPTYFYEGNAVIAAKDADGTVLWSWHIWLTRDEIQSHVYPNNVGTMMDRNLGALSATEGDITSFGLLYQWGRKDPFLAGSNASYSSSFTPKVCTSTHQSDWNVVGSTEETGTIEYAIQHPMTFITSNTKTYDWYYMYTDRNTTDLTRWGAKKTIYDPCPAGWKIPAGGRSTNDNGVWGYFPYGDNVYNFGTYGITFPAQYCGVSAWYPAPGMISNNTGKLQFSGKEGRYWTYSVWETSYSWEDSHIFTCFSFYYNDNDTSNDGSGSYGGVPGAYGNSVRCVKER